MPPATRPLNQLQVDPSDFFIENQHVHEAYLPIEDAADILEDFWKLPDEIRFCAGENEPWIDDSLDGLLNIDENYLAPKVAYAKKITFLNYWNHSVMIIAQPKQNELKRCEIIIL